MTDLKTVCCIAMLSLGICLSSPAQSADDLSDALKKVAPVISILENLSKSEQETDARTENSASGPDSGNRLPQRFNARPRSDDIGHLIAVAAAEFDFARLNDEDFVAAYASSKDCESALSALRHPSDLAEFADKWRETLSQDAKANTLIGKTIVFNMDVTLGEYQEAIGGFAVYDWGQTKGLDSGAVLSGLVVSSATLKPCQNYGFKQGEPVMIAVYPTNSKLLWRVPATAELRRSIEEHQAGPYGRKTQFTVSVSMRIDGALMEQIFSGRDAGDFARGGRNPRRLALLGPVQDVSIAAKSMSGKRSELGSYSAETPVAGAVIPEKLHSKLMLLHAIRLSPSLLENPATAWHMAHLVDCGTTQEFKKREELLGDDSGYLDFVTSRIARAANSLGSLEGRTILWNLRTNSANNSKVSLKPYDAAAGGFPNSSGMPVKNTITYQCAEFLGKNFGSRSVAKLELPIQLLSTRSPKLDFIPVDNATYRKIAEIFLEASHFRGPHEMITNYADSAFAAFSVTEESIGKQLSLTGETRAIHVRAPIGKVGEVYLTWPGDFQRPTVAQAGQPNDWPSGQSAGPSAESPAPLGLERVVESASVPDNWDNQCIRGGSNLHIENLVVLRWPQTGQKVRSSQGDLFVNTSYDIRSYSCEAENVSFAIERVPSRPAALRNSNAEYEFYCNIDTNEEVGTCVIRCEKLTESDPDWKYLRKDCETGRKREVRLFPPR